MLGVVILSLMATQSTAHLPSLSCKVQFVNSGQLVQITGVLQSVEDQSGRFRMSILSQSGSSTSLSQQSGKFQVDAAGEIVLGRSTISNSVGSTVAVKISGESDQTQEVFDCRADI